MKEMDCKQKSDHAIGVFDYGSGGLTVVQAIAHVLPNEKFIFLADEAKVNQKEEEETARRHKIEDALCYANFLSEQNVKMIVVACNLMSVFAMDALQKHFDIPVVGLVQPGIDGLKDQIDCPENKKVAVFTTDMAAYLNLFSQIYEKAYPGIQVYEIGCGNLPKVIDDDLVGTAEADQEVRKCTEQTPKDISAALLACTRFPILMDSFVKSLPVIPIIDPAKNLAAEVKHILEKEDLTTKRVQPNDSVFYTTGNLDAFQNVAKHCIDAIPFSVKQAENLR